MSVTNYLLRNNLIYYSIGTTEESLSGVVLFDFVGDALHGVPQILYKTDGIYIPFLQSTTQQFFNAYSLV